MSFQKTVFEEPVKLFGNAKVKVVKMGHLLEVQHMTHTNKKAHTKKISKDEYINLATGEICEYHHNENRAQNSNSLAKSFKKLRHLINNNFTGAKNELFVTLTFAKNSSDPETVYKDCEKFIKKLKYKFKQESTIDYINVVEPHGSGQFHTHLLLRFNELKKVQLAKEEVEKIWGHGFVKVKGLQEVDNIGAYLSAYLSDMELPENTVLDEKRLENVEVKIVDGKEKKFLKGGRLHFYPSGMRIVRSSRGIKEPEKLEMRYSELKKEVKGKNPHFSKSVRITSDDYTNTITYEQYNLNRL